MPPIDATWLGRKSERICLLRAMSRRPLPLAAGEGVRLTPSTVSPRQSRCIIENRTNFRFMCERFAKRFLKHYSH